MVRVFRVFGFMVVACDADGGSEAAVAPGAGPSSPRP